MRCVMYRDLQNWASACYVPRLQSCLWPMVFLLAYWVVCNIQHMCLNGILMCATPVITVSNHYILTLLHRAKVKPLQ